MMGLSLKNLKRKRFVPSDFVFSFDKIKEGYINVDAKNDVMFISKDFFEYDPGKVSEISGPYKMLTVFLTTGCNYRCKYCFMGEWLNKKRVKLEDLRIFFDEVAPFFAPGSNIFLSGGEISLVPELTKSAVQMVRDYFISPKLVAFSNGSFGDNFVRIAKDFDTFYITYEGTPELQRRLRGGNPEIVRKNIRALSSENLVIALMLTQEKAGKEKEIAEELASLGVQRVDVGPIAPVGFGIPFWNRLSPKGYGLLLSKIQSALESQGIKVLFDYRCDAVQFRNRCGVGYTMLTFGVDSSISSCNIVGFCREISSKYNNWIGDVKNGKVVWYDDRIAYLRNRYSASKCSTCSLYPLCGSCILVEKKGKRGIEIDPKHCELQKEILHHQLTKFAKIFLGGGV